MRNITSLHKARRRSGLSQRGLADHAGIAFRTIQLLEGGRHDPQVSTLRKIAVALGYPPRMMERKIASIFQSPPDSIVSISEALFDEGEPAWKIRLFNFVDAFRNDPRVERVQIPPMLGLTPSLRALLASTVETLCDEQEMDSPEWCHAISSLPEPWFVSGMENLKASALVESPVHFRKRNLFVLENFLKRA